ncbi:DUF2996 domain-containing protein [Pseudanabaena sp. PCC 6802]|uniref:DUF2996 domain-containing protein n=1 Tax=Pseudanabaena sp. PCC 6802 TaxID=118173 RepID=UPI000349AD0E|nr:DUF2996 domain-containing protein [Pseudanabaena sp. PCC 6802]
MAEETTPESKVKTGEKPKAKAKAEKVKEPTIEELPFAEFVGKHYVPALAKALQAKGIGDLDLKFEQSQVQGRWFNGLRSFTIYFTNQDINAQKAFSCADGGLKPSTIEPFLIDERKATLDLLVFGVVQRLNAQKWLMAN